MSRFLLSHGTVLQVIGTAALLLCVLALGDQRNTSIPDGLQPVLVGGAVLVIGISMGCNSGYAINPARDLGPRLFTYIAGWGVDVFRLVLSVFSVWFTYNPIESLIALTPAVFAGLGVAGGGCP